MNKNYLKAAALHLYIFSVVVSICIVDSTMIPIWICIGFYFPIKKMLSTMTEYQIQNALGVRYLEKKFKNNPLVMDLRNE